MKRITLVISAVLCFFSATITFATDAVKKVVTRPSDKESPAVDNSGKDKLERKNPLVDKTRPKASGDPHVDKAPEVSRSQKRTN